MKPIFIILIVVGFLCFGVTVFFSVREPEYSPVYMNGHKNKEIIRVVSEKEIIAEEKPVVLSPETEQIAELTDTLFFVAVMVMGVSFFTTFTRRLRF